MVAFAHIRTFLFLLQLLWCVRLRPLLLAAAAAAAAAATREAVAVNDDTAVHINGVEPTDPFAVLRVAAAFVAASGPILLVVFPVFRDERGARRRRECG